MTYRTKSFIVEHMQWRLDNADALIAWGAPIRWPVLPTQSDRCVLINTLGGGAIYVVDPFAFIIRDENGVYYPITSDLFTVIFEPVAETT